MHIIIQFGRSFKILLIYWPLSNVSLCLEVKIKITHALKNNNNKNSKTMTNSIIATWYCDYFLLGNLFYYTWDTYVLVLFSLLDFKFFAHGIFIIESFPFNTVSSLKWIVNEWMMNWIKCVQFTCVSSFIFLGPNIFHRFWKTLWNR